MMTTELSKQDAIDFRSCVQIVRKGMNTFREVGQALARIRDEQWYKQSHKTFEAFCIAEFGFKRSHAYRLIEAAAVAETSPVGDKLETERQARKHLQEQRQAADTAIDALSPAYTDDHAGDADGGAEPCTVQRAGTEADPVGVVEPVELDRVKFAKVRFGFAWEEYEAAFGDDAAWCYFSAAWEQFKESAGYE